MVLSTKLILAMLTLVASVTLMAATADTANAAVTEIRTVDNNTDRIIYIWNHESGAYNIIFPGQSRSFNQRVPWATSVEDFDRGHYIEVGIYETAPSQCSGIFLCPRFSFWQEYRSHGRDPGDKIRYTGSPPLDTGPRRYNSDAPAMPGASYVGGRRNLVIKYLGVGYPYNLNVYLQRVE